MDFGFSLDAVPTIDMVLVFAGLSEGRWRRLRSTSSSRTS